jgi:Arc/MetJ-type ribon-helix-helix transcriptional regulator
MALTLNPEQESLVEQAVHRGRYSTSAEALEAAISTLRPNLNPVLAPRPRTGPIRSKNLADLLSEEPWKGSALDITRDQSPGRDTDL